MQLLDLLRASLTELGYRVQAVPSGMQALALARQYSFDAVILDSELPSLSSIETVRRLHDLLGSAMPPVLYLSLCPKFRHHPQLPQGRAEHLSKPYRTNDLLQRLALLLQTPVL